MRKKLLAVAVAVGMAMSIPAGAAAAELMGTDEAVTVHVGLIMGPPSMGLGWMMNENDEGNTYNSYEFEVCGVDYTEVAAKLNAGDFDIITCPSNVSAILYNNTDMKEEVEVISIGNLGLLYVLTTDASVQSMEDLAGRTVYSIGEGGPPEYTFGYLLEQEGLADSVNFSFRSTPFEVLNLLQEEENAIALLPQPFVEVAKLLVEDLYTAIDVTAAWDALGLESGAESVTTVTVVRKAFLEEHEQAVIEYLNLSKQSVAYTLANVSEAAAWTDTYETFLNATIAADAIPYCSICAITGEEMREKLEGFLQIMYDYNPDAVGGSMPEDDFYYIPPEGTVFEAEVLETTDTKTEAAVEEISTEETAEPETLTEATPGTYTVSANIWFNKEDSGLPMNPHITSNIFPPKDPVADNATLTVLEDGTAYVKVPILIQNRIMKIESIEGLALLEEEQNEEGYLTSVTIDLGTITYLEEVVTGTCTVSLKMGDLAMSISGFDEDQCWPATFQMNGFSAAVAVSVDEEISDEAVSAAVALAFGGEDETE